MMTWFLVILFWNPGLPGFDVADGWYPLPYATEEMCESKLDFVSSYITVYSGDEPTVQIGCIEANAMWPAIQEMKGNVNE